MVQISEQQCCKRYFFAVFKYKIQNTFEKNVFEILSSNTFEVNLKIQNTFFQSISNTKCIQTDNCRFFQQWKTSSPYMFTMSNRAHYSEPTFHT